MTISTVAELVRRSTKMRRREVVMGGEVDFLDGAEKAGTTTTITTGNSSHKNFSNFKKMLSCSLIGIKGQSVRKLAISLVVTYKDQTVLWDQ